MRKANSVAMILLVLVFAAVVAAPAVAQQSDIPTTVMSLPNYSTAFNLAQAAGIVDQFRGGGPYTVFVPTNTAFSKLPYGTLNWLMMPENRDVLRSILMYHVVNGRYLSTDIISQSCPAFTLSSLTGPMLRLTHGRMGVTVNNAFVVQPDIIATNGVIHGIDRVLLPPNIVMR